MSCHTRVAPVGDRGLTLIELLVIIVIVAIPVAIVIPIIPHTNVKWPYVGIGIIVIATMGIFLKGYVALRNRRRRERRRMYR